MKYILILSLFFVSVFAVDYLDLYDARGKGYNNSNVRIDGKFDSFFCTNGKKSIYDYCNVYLKIYDGGKFLNRVSLKVGTTYKSSFRYADKGDTYSFDCTYKGNLFTFYGCN